MGTRGNAVKIRSMMETMNTRNTRRVPAVRLNTSVHFLRLASHLQVRDGEKCQMVVLSNGMLMSVPGLNHLVPLALEVATFVICDDIYLPGAVLLTPCGMCGAFICVAPITIEQMHGSRIARTSNLQPACNFACTAVLLQPFKPIASTLSKLSSPTPVDVWIRFQEQTMDEDAPTNVKGAQAAATKRSFDKIFACNELSNLIKKRNQEEEQCGNAGWAFEAITGHVGPMFSSHHECKGSLCNVKVLWEDNSKMHEPLVEMIRDDPVSCAMRAKENDLLETPGWKA
jgi:hypothetical protein